VSIVLLLAVGQDAALLCRAWCHPGGAPMSECAERLHPTMTPLVGGDDSCGRVAVSGVMLPREDPRPVSDPNGRCATVESRVELAPMTVGLCLPRAAGLASVESLPLIIALRI
jgi:hypothetical protein